MNDKRITVLNNELGFSEANIRALCDIGNSTKTGSKLYIGKKGIGFKSVFRVTDRPEIHSSGFHIAFDSKDFIIPHWLDEQSFDPSDIEHMNAWNTMIALPIREETKRRGLLSLSGKFEEMKPASILFL